MAALDLTSVANVRAWIPSPSGAPPPAVLAAQTSVLQAAITSASLDFLRRTGRGPASWVVPAQSPFAQSVQYSETYSGNGNDTQLLRNWPVLSVQSLTIDGLAVLPSSGPGSPGYDISDKANSIILRGASSIGRVGFGRGSIGMRFPRGTQNIAITYTAGFAEQSITGELQSIPAFPGPYVVTPAQPWLSDGGVKYFSNGTALEAVQIAPQQGQYFLSGGTYLFNAADAGQQILLAYTASGTPPDIELAVRRMVFLTYKRRDWEGLRSLAKPESGTTSYQTWEVDPGVLEVIRNYTRTAIV